MTDKARSSRSSCSDTLFPTRAWFRCLAWIAESQQGQIYVDARNGFSLRPPLDWAQASKSGAEVIFKDPSYKFNNLGVTVTPVRVGSLQEFATVEEAADRLISFEKNKVSEHTYWVPTLVVVPPTLTLVCFLPCRRAQKWRP